MTFLSVLRLTLYCILWVFSVVLLGLTGARIHYTENLSPYDPLNGGHHFYDSVIVELLVTSIFVMLWSVFAAYVIYTRQDHLIVHTFAAESIALFVLFMMWLGGTGNATSMWGNLGWCQQYSPCRLLSALVGIAWTGWVILLFLLGFSLMHSLVNRAWNEPMHGHLYPRDSFVPAQMSEYRGSHA